jgi:hypothetical protein
MKMLAWIYLIKMEKKKLVQIIFIFITLVAAFFIFNFFILLKKVQNYQI